MSRKLLGMVLSLGVLASLVLSAPSAYATYSVYLYQNGNNVDATGTGSINLTGLTDTFASGQNKGGGLDPSDSNIGMGSVASVEMWFGDISGPGNFGSGHGAYASSSSGDPLFLGPVGSDGFLFLPQGYTSGTTLANTDIFDNTTLTALGVTTGTYTWTWGNGAGEFILYAGESPFSSSTPSATPEPSAWALFGTGFLILMGAARKKRWLQA